MKLVTSRNWLTDLLLEFKQVLAHTLLSNKMHHERGDRASIQEDVHLSTNNVHRGVVDKCLRWHPTMPNLRTFSALKSFGSDGGVKNEKSNLFASSTPSWCTLGLNQARDTRVGHDGLIEEKLNTPEPPLKQKRLKRNLSSNSDTPTTAGHSSSSFSRIVIFWLNSES